MLNNEHLKQAQTLKTNVIGNLNTQISELMEYIKQVQELYPDYKSPVTLTTSPKPKSSEPIETRLMAFLSTNIAERKSRGKLVAHLCENPNCGYKVDKCLKSLLANNIISPGGFTIKQIHPPEDTHPSYIKVKA
jgi:hypothetical protein